VVFPVRPGAAGFLEATDELLMRHAAVPASWLIVDGVMISRS